jgi:hypothetical protein
MVRTRTLKPLFTERAKMPFDPNDENALLNPQQTIASRYR